MNKLIIYKLNKLSFVVLPLCVAHVARLEEFFVHRQRATQRVRRVRGLRHLQVLVEQRAVLRVNAVVDYLMRALNRALPAQVGDTVLRDDNLHAVLRVVEVADHRHKSRDAAAFRRGRGGVDTDVRIAGEVAGAADAVHHLRAAHMRRVDVAEDVCLQCRVDGYQA